MTFQNRISSPGTTIRLTVSFYKNGVLFDPDIVSDVTIWDNQSGGTQIYGPATPVKQSVGVYYIDYNIPSGAPEGVFYYDEWSWAAQTGQDPKVQRYAFLTGAVGDIFAAEPSGGSLSFELRFQAIETTVNNIVLAINNLAYRQQLVQISAIMQRTDQYLQEQLDALTVRVEDLEP